MANRMKKIPGVDAYIKNQPKAVQPILKKIRATIRAAAPGAEEAMSYGIPTFKLHGKNLVHYGAWTEHIGFYATPAGNAAFQHRIAKYKGAKGSIQFPLDKPMPYGLIKEMARFRVKEVAAKFKPKAAAKKPAARAKKK